MLAIYGFHPEKNLKNKEDCNFEIFFFLKCI